AEPQAGWRACRGTVGLLASLVSAVPVAVLHGCGGGDGPPQPPPAGTTAPQQRTAASGVAPLLAAAHALRRRPDRLAAGRRNDCVVVGSSTGDRISAQLEPAAGQPAVLSALVHDRLAGGFAAAPAPDSPRRMASAGVHR